MLLRGILDIYEGVVGRTLVENAISVGGGLLLLITETFRLIAETSVGWDEVDRRLLIADVELLAEQGEMELVDRLKVLILLIHKVNAI